MKMLLILMTPVMLFGSILFDPHMSPHAASEDLLFLFKTLEKGEDKLVPAGYRDRHPRLSTLGRLIDLSWMNFLAGYGSVTVHEVFGHGYRIRSLGDHKVKVAGYQIGPDNGATGFYIYPSLTTAEFTAITIAGIEAQEVLAECVKRDWFLQNIADARQARLYTMNRLTPFLYALVGVFEISGPADLFGAHDLKAYMRELNLLYPGHQYTQVQLARRALLNLVDPTLYNALYSFFRYLMIGESAPMWSIPIGSYRYLPALTTYFAPYGIEYGLLNLLKREAILYTFYLKGGQMSNRQYGGLGLEVMPLMRLRQADIGFCVDLWRQPRLDTPSIMAWAQVVPFPTPLGKDRLGGRIGVNISANLSQDKAYQAILQMGLKTQGYLPGYRLAGGSYVRGGVKLSY